MAVELKLSSLKGQWVVVYFYPKDSTPGCTNEAKDFRDLYPAFRKRDAQIIGVSRDSVQLARQLRRQAGASVPAGLRCRRKLVQGLRRDPREVLYGKRHLGIVRSTFLIDPDGSWRAMARGESGRPRPGRARRHARQLTSTTDRRPCHGRPGPPASARAGRLSLPHQRGYFRMTGSKRIYVLDTNVLMHDPTSLFRFEEHDVFIPMTVLEELDEKKKGASEVSRNGRQVSRFLNELIERGKQPRHRATASSCSNPQGIKLKRGGAVGRLYFQQRTSSNGHGKADNQILAAVIDLRDQHPDRAVILVTKDINLRIKASIYGIVAEDYENDRALDDFALLYTGATELPEDFWDRHPEVRSWTERGRTFYEWIAREERGLVRRTSACSCPATTRSSCACCRSTSSSATLVLLDDHSARQPQRLGHRRAQSRAELRAQRADGSGHRLRHPARHRRHRQDPAGAGRRPGPDDGPAALSRDHHDPRHGLGRRGHRLPARHRGRKDDAVDGRAHRQPRSAGQSRGRRQLGPPGDQRPARLAHQDPLAQLHARAHLPVALPDHRRGAEPHARSR